MPKILQRGPTHVEVRRLPYDVARCTDYTCPRADDCKRFRDRNHLGPRTPVIAGCRNFHEQIKVST